MSPKELDELFSNPTVNLPVKIADCAVYVDPGHTPSRTSVKLVSAVEEASDQAMFQPLRPCRQEDIVVRTACSLHPKNVIFNPPATIVEWSDGTKTVVKCHDDEFSEEFGYAMAVMRKIYGSRKEFMAQFKNAYRPYLKPKKSKKTKSKPEDQASSGVQS